MSMILINRIGRRFDVREHGVCPEGCAPLGQVGAFDEGGLYAQAAQRLIEEGEGLAEDLALRHHVAARFSRQRHQAGGDRTHA